MKDEICITIHGVLSGREIIHQMEVSQSPELLFLDDRNLDAIPELIKAKLCIQRNNESVFDHTMNVLRMLDNRRRICLIGALFHDLGKMEILQPENNKPRFLNHEFASSSIARQYMHLWRLDYWTLDRVSRLIETHMTDIKFMRTDRAVRNFIARVGEDNLDNWFSLRMADCTAYGFREGNRQMIIDFRDRITQLLKMHEVSENELTVTRQDLSIIAGVPDEVLDDIIKKLLQSINTFTVENDFETLLNMAAAMVADKCIKV